MKKPDLGEDELAAAIASLSAPGAVVIDYTELLIGCEASGVLSKIITRGAGRPLGLVFVGDPEALASGFLDQFCLDGRVAIVTGAYSGLGVGFAQALAQAGADMVLAARREEKLAGTSKLVQAESRRAPGPLLLHTDYVRSAGGSD